MKKRISGVVWLLIIIFIVISISYQFAKILSNKRSRLKTLSGISTEYSSLFLQSAKKITRAKSYVLYNTNINPISEFNYDDKYWVVITKLKTKILDSLPPVYLKNGMSGLTQGEVYAGFDEGYFHLDVLPDSAVVSDILLTINGNSTTRVVKRKDLIAYSSRLKSISISYNNLRRNNLSIESSSNEAQSYVLLLKRGEFSYFIFISPVYSNNPTSSKAFDLNQILQKEIVQ